MNLARTFLEKFHPKSSEAAFWTVFFLYNFRLEVDNDAISGAGVDNVGMDVAIKCSDSRPNGFRDIRGADFVNIDPSLSK